MKHYNLKWKGITQPPEESEPILFEIYGHLETGIKFKGEICTDIHTFSLNNIDKWMYEDEAKKILFEKSFPNLNYEQSEKE